MATLKEAITYAKANPTDAKSERLKQAIIMGKMDSIAQTEGIDLSAFKSKVAPLASKILPMVTPMAQQAAETVKTASPSELSTLAEGAKVDEAGREEMKKGIEMAKSPEAQMLKNTGFGSGLATLGGNILEKGKEGLGTVVEGGKEMIKGEGTGYAKVIEGLLGTVFSPVSGTISSIPGGETAAKYTVGLPRMAVEAILDKSLESSGVEKGSDQYNSAKENVMAAFDVALALIPGTKKGRATVESGIEGLGKAKALVKEKAVEGTKATVAKTTGLNKSTLETISQTPNEFKAAKAGEITRETLSDRVTGAIKNRESEISMTGKEYEVIKQAPVKVQTPIKVIEDNLTQKGLVIKKGEVTEANPLSTNLSKADLNAVNEAYGLVKGLKDLSPDQVLNLRAKIDALVDWNTEVTGKGEALVKGIRKEVDNVAKEQIPGLKNLDAKYSAEIGELRKIKKDYFNRDGSLKDGALSKIANLTKAGREPVLARLEQVTPGISKEINALRAIEDVELTSGNKVGTYFSAGSKGGSLLGLGYSAATGNLPGIAASVLMSIISSPSIVTKVLLKFAERNADKAGLVKDMVSKIEKGEKLTKAEGVILSLAIATPPSETEDSTE